MAHKFDTFRLTKMREAATDLLEEVNKLNPNDSDRATFEKLKLVRGLAKSVGSTAFSSMEVLKNRQGELRRWNV